MILAEDSRRKLEAFFREILNDEQFRLPSIYFYSGQFSGFLTRALKIYAITIGKNIFVTPQFISLADDAKRKIHLELAAHEITHVVQYEREGFARFFYKYLTRYWKNLRAEKTWDAAARQRAYLNIPFEIDARETAAKFVEWNAENGKRKIV